MILIIVTTWFISYMLVNYLTSVKIESKSAEVWINIYNGLDDMNLY
jgi:hypothetical protein